VALLGLLAYLSILITLRTQGNDALFTGYVLPLIGFGFSLYLTYREVFTIHAICSWCVSSAIVFTLLAVVQRIRLLDAGRPARSPAAQTA
jgi:uncharacterized membrane protein